MTPNLILAIERDFTTLENIAKHATVLSTDGTPMPDGKGTVATRYRAALTAFGPVFAVMIKSILTPEDAAELDSLVADAHLLTEVKPPAPAGDAAAPGTTILAGAFVGDGSPTKRSAPHGTAPVTCTMKTSSDLVKEVGDFHIYGDRTHICIWLPGDTFPITLSLKSAGDPKGWVLGGTDERPTLSPSIFRDPPNGWHGFLTNGILTSVHAGGNQPAAIAVTNDFEKPAVDATPATIQDQLQPDPARPKKFWMAGMPRE